MNNDIPLTQTFIETLWYIIKFLYLMPRVIFFIICTVFDPSNLQELKAGVAENKTKMIKGVRPIAEAIGFRLLMGNFYQRGFLLDYVRTKSMQSVKLNAIVAQKKIVDAHLGGNITQKSIPIALFKDLTQKKNLYDGVGDLVRYIVKDLLNLPESLDLKVISAISGKDNLDSFFNHLRHQRPIFTIYAYLTGNYTAAKGTKGYAAQKHLREFICSGNWDPDCYCADVISAGEKQGIDARGVLAELITGMSYNIGNVLSALMYSAVYGPSDIEKSIIPELVASCDRYKDLTDREFVALDSSDVHKWMYWALGHFPNLHNVIRIDVDTGRVVLCNIIDAWGRPDELTAPSAEDRDVKTFSLGRFACPGQYLAKVSMLLALRYLFTTTSTVTATASATAAAAAARLNTTAGVAAANKPSSTNNNDLSTAKRSGYLNLDYNNAFSKLNYEWTETESCTLVDNIDDHHMTSNNSI